MHKEIEINFTSPIEIAVNGDFITASSGKLSCATQKQIEDNGVLTIAFFKARNKFAFEAAKTLSDEEKAEAKKRLENGETDESIDAETVLNIMFSNLESKDITKVYSSMSNLLSGGCLAIDGVDKVDNKIISKLSIKDINKCIGEYIANFI